jgi:hypothetical protein
MFNMLELEHNSFVTITPGLEPPPCGATRFRWSMQVALPFPFPARMCAKERGTRNGREYEFAIHNHLDRFYLMPPDRRGWPVVGLVDKAQKPDPGRAAIERRESLQAVAVFTELLDYSVPNEAFKVAADKVKDCFSILSDFLLAQQKAAPYLVTWLIYPVSQFEVDVVYQWVDHFCPNRQRWEYMSAGMTVNVARRMEKPLFFLDRTDPGTIPPELDTSYELLAEAQMSLFRGIRRLSVINAYAAVESLANAVFKRARAAQLVGSGTDPVKAETTSEEERKKHRTDEKFLLHHGLHAAAGRSLCTENKQLYDDLLTLKELRHKAAHAGFLPDYVTAKSAHRTCCLVVQWLSEVGGFPRKELLPDAKDIVPGYQASFSDSFACPPERIEFIGRVFGLAGQNRGPEKVPSNESCSAHAPGHPQNASPGA